MRSLHLCGELFTTRISPQSYFDDSGRSTGEAGFPRGWIAVICGTRILRVIHGRAARATLLVHENSKIQLASLAWLPGERVCADELSVRIRSMASDARFPLGQSTALRVGSGVFVLWCSTRVCARSAAAIKDGCCVSHNSERPFSRSFCFFFLCRRAVVAGGARRSPHRTKGAGLCARRYEQQTRFTRGITVFSRKRKAGKRRTAYLLSRLLVTFM